MYAARGRFSEPGINISESKMVSLRKKSDAEFHGPKLISPGSVFFKKF